LGLSASKAGRFELAAIHAQAACWQAAFLRLDKFGKKKLLLALLNPTLAKGAKCVETIVALCYICD
jgi:hypothetical protein